MPDVLIGAPAEQAAGGVSATDIKDSLELIGYQAAIKVGCLKTIDAALSDDAVMVTAIVLDSQLVGQSLRLKDFPNGIVEKLRERIPSARLVVYMTKPYDDLGEKIQRAVQSTDAIVDMPTDGNEVAFKVSALLAYLTS